MVKPLSAVVKHCGYTSYATVYTTLNVYGLYFLPSAFMFSPQLGCNLPFSTKFTTITTRPNYKSITFT